MSEEMTICEACGKPMPSGTYVTDEDGVSACLPAMSDGKDDGPCADRDESEAKA
jgi:hypothetical protein